MWQGSIIGVKYIKDLLVTAVCMIKKKEYMSQHKTQKRLNDFNVSHSSVLVQTEGRGQTEVWESLLPFPGCLWN